MRGRREKEEGIKDGRKGWKEKEREEGEKEEPVLSEISYSYHNCNV